MRIALFGNFGVENIGNECTLQAMLHAIRERLPDADVFGIVTDTEKTLARHGLRSVPIRADYIRGLHATGGRRRNLLSRLCRLAFVRLPGEIAGWVKAFRTLKSTDILAMTGTGMLSDGMTSAFGLPYEIFKWSCAARLRGCRVRFVAVGVGPTDQRFSRWFITGALALADYRSYRDEASKARLARIGFNKRDDSVIPDLAFSLPPSLLQASVDRGRSGIVGVGVMDYYGARGERGNAVYWTYLSKMADFVIWLLARGHVVRVLHGDIMCDAQVRKDLRVLLEGKGVRFDDPRIIDEDIRSVEDLISQLASTEIVVSPRFHNLLLAILLNKPVVSISYDVKNDCLLDAVGLGSYTQPIEDLDVDRLIAQFTELRNRFGEIGSVVQRAVATHRQIWMLEYPVVLGKSWTGLRNRGGALRSEGDRGEELVQRQATPHERSEEHGEDAKDDSDGTPVADVGLAADAPLRIDRNLGRHVQRPV